jgi:hypothetical protein
MSSSTGFVSVKGPVPPPALLLLAVDEPDAVFPEVVLEPEALLSVELLLPLVLLLLLPPKHPVVSAQSATAPTPKPHFRLFTSAPRSLSIG